MQWMYHTVVQGRMTHFHQAYTLVLIHVKTLQLYFELLIPLMRSRVLIAAAW